MGSYGQPDCDWVRVDDQIDVMCLPAKWSLKRELRKKETMNSGKRTIYQP